MSILAERMKLSGRRALVTGASGGLGEHFARVLAAAGADLVLAARRRDRLEVLAAELNESGVRADVVEMDVTSADSVKAAFAQIIADGAPVCDIIINNSGVGQDSWFLKITEEEWQSIIDTNLTGVWRVGQAAAQALVAAEKPGTIVNIASILGLAPSYRLAGYAASKAGVDHLTRSMAVELARSAIRVNAIAPGYFRTAINQDVLDSEIGDKMIRRIPMRRSGNYEELDGALLMLASDAGSFMTGSTIVVDGGHSLSPV